MTDRIEPHSLLEFQINDLSVKQSVKDLVSSIYKAHSIQQLNEYTENNPYHSHENVLEHIQTVFSNLLNLLQFDFVLDDSLRTALLQYMNRKVDPYGALSRKELLLIACSLHDIGKATQLVVIDDQGNTKAPGHEHASASIVPIMLDQANSTLTDTEISLIQLLVDRHDTYSEGYLSTHLTFDISKDMSIIRSTQPQFYIELMLHILADNYGAEIYKKYDTYLKEQLFNSPELLVH